MAPPKPEIEPAWDAKRAIADDKYDDCLACRATGIVFLCTCSYHISDNFFYRLCRFHRSGSVQLLYGDAKFTEARACHHEGSNSVQDALAAVGDIWDIGNTGGHGSLESFQLEHCIASHRIASHTWSLSRLHM